MTTTTAVQHALLRARELCLVGEYDQGISEFCAVKKTLGTQLRGLAHARDFLDELQHEYRTIVEYRTSLETLATMENQSRNSRQTKAPVVARRSQRQMPLWMHRGKPRAPELSRSGAAAASDSEKRSKIHDEVIFRLWSNNQTRKDTKRSGTLTTARTNVNRRKTRREPQLQSAKRRESVQSAASLNSTGACQDTIAEKMKYSEMARENGWVDQELIEIIERDIVDHGEKVTFENVAGLEHIKQLLQETVMLPQMAPHLFTAVAHECETTFFNVTASTLSSKYRGDSEKLVRILFDMARYYEPSIIFMDEIDAIASTRGAVTEHEASRRVKTELLVQVSGVTSMEYNGSQVMLLAATNFPWELDEAMRRRLTKRVYIPLPGTEARRTLFELNLGRIDVSKDVKLDDLVKDTEGYSGDDITNVCETAKRMPVKRVYTPELLLKMRRDMEAGEGHREFEIERLVVTKADFVEALSNVSKSVGHDQLRRYEEWEAEFGSK
uniref:AAA+ ATPase domain-containing protein n=1 Tax=Hyaloperonospora arabidopsidis (strain Emoy2) TaxID=559515 RepID=M4C0N8_HYAAE